MMWPVDAGGIVLALYVATLALHAAFVAYVAAGTGYTLVQALRRRDDPIAEVVRDRLPFMLGCGITAGVAPLLFVQLLYQRRFYTANLLLGPRWLAIVPALVVGFYALYAVKSWSRWRRAALAVALACFAFVAWSWGELHELMLADARWRDFYAAGERVYFEPALAPRFIAIGGAMTGVFALVAAWSADAASRRRLAVLALCARIVSIGGAAWLAQRGFAIDGPVRAWLVVLALAIVVEAGAWLVVRRRASDAALAVATAAGAAVIVAAIVVREAPRLALLEPSPAESGGAIVFALALVLGAGAIAWIVRAVRANSLAPPEDGE
jgi:hypothetical protein